MKILNDIEIVDKCLLIKKRILVIADLHIGYEEALNKQGIFVPRMQFKETKKEINKVFKKLNRKKIENIIINGDLKHEFGEISTQEWFETYEILNIFEKHCKKIILVKGNHDTILKPIAKRKGLKIEKKYIIDNEIAIIHGDEIIEDKEINKCKILIIAHEHPAISLYEEPKSEKYKCFLLGNFRNKKLVVMPSFLPIIEGTDVRKEELLSPYLKRDIGNFKVFIVGDKTYKFGKLKNIG
ncbi:MAG: metallophosphoesterase [Candidatus Pacearchaeota archaeon]